MAANKFICSLSLRYGPDMLVMMNTDENFSPEIQSDVEKQGQGEKMSPVVKETNVEYQVDVPRCHQYDQLLTSPMAHEKLKRILKAWLKSQPNLVYWQGLDSLCAPFLHMHFDNEALAFASFKSFTQRYLSGLFAKHNAPFIQECLAVFAHLIEFHDPQLHVHLEEIGFSTDLYAIPWLLTMFAHALSMGRLLPVWDAIIVRNDRSFGLCFGVALLRAHRRRLLAAGFNESILLFSDLPSLWFLVVVCFWIWIVANFLLLGIDVYSCLEEASRIYDKTPPSVAHLVQDQKNDTGAATSFSRLSSNELREMPCARISAGDLPKPGIPQSNNTWDPIMIVDVRPFEERQRFAPDGSVHVPLTAFPRSVPENQGENQSSQKIGFTLPNCPGTEVLKKHKNEAVVAILSSPSVKPDVLKMFVDGLIRESYERVCMIDDGVAAMKAVNLL